MNIKKKAIELAKEKHNLYQIMDYDNEESQEDADERENERIHTLTNQNDT